MEDIFKKHSIDDFVRAIFDSGINVEEFMEKITNRYSEVYGCLINDVRIPMTKKEVINYYNINGIISTIKKLRSYNITEGINPIGLRDAKSFIEELIK